MASASFPLFDVFFGPNSRAPDLHECLNRIYRDYLPDSTRLLSDPTDSSTILETTALVTRIRNIIVNDMLLPSAGQTHDGNAIALVLKDAALLVGCGQLPPKRVSKPSLLKAIEHATSHDIDTIDLIIDTSMIYSTTTEPLSYHDWSKLTSDASLAAAPLAAHGPTPPDILTPGTTTAVDNSLDRLTQAMTTVFDRLSTTPAPTTTGSTLNNGPSPPRVQPPDTSFNYHPGRLPDDVKERYENKLNGHSITQIDVHKPYAWGHRYFLDGNDHLILADGTLFMRKDFDEKAIFRELVPCLDDSFAGIRKWYHHFTTHLMNNGYYVHPLWCFRKDAGGIWGFTCGDGPDDDLPKRMQISLRSMSHTISRLLSKSDMFPKDSELKNIVAACYGDGYHAIKSILLHVHPIFHETPACLIKNYPQQRNLTLLQYFQLFTDYLQLRAFIKNIKASLDDSDELDVFLGNMKHRDYLIRVTREERRQPALSYKYKGTQLIETLQKFLKAPDSPALTVKPSPSPTYAHHSGNGGNTSKFTTYQPRNCRNQHINNVGLAPSPNTDSLNDLVDQAYSLDIPNNLDDRKLYHAYTAAVNHIHKKPVLVFSGVCICCHGNHRFDDCPNLNDTAYLKDHYKKYCMQVERELESKERLLAASDHRPTKQRQVNFYDCLENDTDNEDTNSSSDSDSDDFHTAEDFQKGRL